MSITATPSVLKWARETSGYTIEDGVTYLKFKSVTKEVFLKWEEGTVAPNYMQLKKLAKFYKRPIALFFFPQPPLEEDIKKDFRDVLPSKIINEIPPSIRYLVRKAKIRQLDLIELHDNTLIDAKVFDISIPKNDPYELARVFRKYIEISIQDQQEWENSEDALKKWREGVEKLGIWIFKDSFGKEYENYCGFCLYHKQFPIVYINNNHSKERQIFTLFHELAHIISRIAGISFYSTPKQVYQKEEVFCNAFAGELIFPSSIIEQYNRLPSDTIIEELAKSYKISYDVVLRKFLDKKIISGTNYTSKILERRKDFSSQSRSQVGGDYYRTKKAYLGEKYINLVFKKYYNQQVNQQQLSEYLGIKISNIPSFEGIL